MKGFSEIIDPTFLKAFDETELELLMGGLPQLNVKDWKDNTEYRSKFSVCDVFEVQLISLIELECSGGFTKDHDVIQWFWRAVQSFSDEERCRLLKFVTGTSHVPVNGFAELHGSNGPQKFTIQLMSDKTSHLPKAHTWLVWFCFLLTSSEKNIFFEMLLFFLQ